MQTATTTDLVLVPVTRFDRERLLDLFGRMSRTTRYQRFLHPKPRLTDEELDYFTDIDHRTHDALAAVDPTDGSFVGVARYATYDDAGTCADLSFVVADEWQGRGVGTRLLDRLIPRAEENGITTFVALTLAENAASRALLKRFGFRRIASDHGVVELHRTVGAALRLAA
jgi:RimJ/RimL family protein N-acetyltransferase